MTGPSGLFSMSGRRQVFSGVLAGTSLYCGSSHAGFAVGLAGIQFLAQYSCLGPI